MAPKTKKRPAAAQEDEDAAEEPATPMPQEPVRGGRGKGRQSMGTAAHLKREEHDETDLGGTQDSTNDQEAPEPTAPPAKKSCPGADAATPPRAAPAAEVKAKANPCLQVPYQPADNSVAAAAPPVCSGLVALRQNQSFCDVAVLASEGQRIPSHRVVLATGSEVLRNIMQEGKPELDLQAYCSEAVNLAVRWLYGEVTACTYAPSGPGVNEEVLRLAFQLGLERLAELGSLCLASGVTASNIVERIKLCEEVGLSRLRAALVTTIQEDQATLEAVSKDPKMLSHPVLMQELLAFIAKRALLPRS